MSALLQTPNLFRSLRRISEAEALMDIGRIATTAHSAATGLEALAAIALRLSGLHGVEVSLNGQDNAANSLEWHDSKSAVPCGAATGIIAAHGKDWGRVRILFEPRIKSVECPLRFARYLAQQAALMLNLVEQRVQRQTLQAAARRVALRLETRKTVSRAAGILASEKKIRYEAGILLLLEKARRKRRTPLAVALGIVLGAEAGDGRSPALRRLGPHDFTAKAAAQR